MVFSSAKPPPLEGQIAGPGKTHPEGGPWEPLPHTAVAGVGVAGRLGVWEGAV